MLNDAVTKDRFSVSKNGEYDGSTNGSPLKRKAGSRVTETANSSVMYTELYAAMRPPKKMMDSRRGTADQIMVKPEIW
jgi:hypothetical protein